MSRLVIDVSGEQHQQIKALAALQGKTIKDLILGKLFTNLGIDDEKEVWGELESLLASRIEEAEQIGASTQTFEELTEEMMKARKQS